MSKQKWDNYVAEAPMVGMSDVIFSDHALRRILERGVIPEDVRGAIERPTRAYWSTHYEAWMYSRGGVIISLRPHHAYTSKWSAVTVLITGGKP